MTKSASEKPARSPTRPPRRGPKGAKPARPRQPREDGTPARLAAMGVLRAVLETGSTLDDALVKELGRPELKNHPSDKALVRAIATIVLRRLGQIDDILARMLDKPLTDKAPVATALLRIGVAELLFLGSAHHAAVNCAVTLAAGDKFARGFKGLINAVLRRVIREGDAILKEQDAARLNLADWAWASWSRAYGEETTRAMAEALLAEPPLDLTIKQDPQQWAETLSGDLLPGGSVRLSHAGRIEELPGFKEGAWWVQDLAASLPPRLLGNVEGEEVLDLCAAPGGKTLSLAARGAHVTAIDRAGGRLERLAENLKRTGLKADIIKADLTTWAPNRKWSKILLDAPCTATGTARRNPDVLYRKSEDEVTALAKLQAELLTRAATWLAPGGTLVFCTCSLEPLEGPAQIGLFLSKNPRFERLPITADEIGDLSECLTPQGDLRTLPSHLGDRGGMDGFYAARLIARAEP
ncbi:MAG: transcription antitermination factor NusB [Parvibaculum sp.]